jgi:hypothetical protein
MKRKNFFWCFFGFLLLQINGFSEWIPPSHEFKFHYGMNYKFPINAQNLNEIITFEETTYLGLDYSALTNVKIGDIILYLGGSFDYVYSKSKSPLSFYNISNNPSDDWRIQPAFFSIEVSGKLVRPLLTSYSDIFCNAGFGYGEGVFFQNHGNDSKNVPFIHETYFWGHDVTVNVGGGIEVNIPVPLSISFPDVLLSLDYRYKWVVFENVEDPNGIIELNKLDFTSGTFLLGIGLRF